MKTEKTLWHRFDECGFDEELGLLDAMSEQGWQLADMRVFTQKYVFDDSTVYRYAIDHQKKLSKTEFEQYRAEFGDQSWDYVTRYGDWYVFRKPYDPTLPEEDYLLYTDEPSFRDMKNAAVAGFSFLCLVQFLRYLTEMNLCVLLMLLWLVCFCIFAALRELRVKRVRRYPKPYRFHLWRFSGAALLLLFLLLLAGFRAEKNAQKFQMQGPAVGVQSEVITIRMPDYYDLYMLIHPADQDDPIPAPAYFLTDAGGRTVDSGLMDPNGKPTNVFLRAGTYMLTIDWDAGSPPGEERADDGSDYSARILAASFDVFELLGLPSYTSILVFILSFFGFIAWAVVEIVKRD